MKKEICFDMDGTLVDLYGVENWLDYILNENTYPFENAKPLVKFNTLARILNQLQRKGYEINIITWTPKNATKEYNNRVANAKMKYLEKHLHSVHFDHINIIEYGTNKSHYGKGILFDDEVRNREQWNGKAYDVDNIINILKQLM